MPHAVSRPRLLLAALLAAPLAGTAPTSAAAQGFSMHPSEELSQPLPHRPRRPAPPPASRTPASRAPAARAPAAPPASPPAPAPSQP